MDGYDQAFVLPDEREDLAGFQACLSLNQSHRRAFGRTHSELVAVIEDDAGVRLGGMNFLATAITRGETPLAAVALNYLYVDKAVRGRGLLRTALRAVRRLAQAALDLDPDGPPPVLFIEQNDPLRLTADEYAADTRHSGLDQVDRLEIWARLGARVVDFPYVQPALSADQAPDDSLIYTVIDWPHAAMDAGLLHDHLQSFFAISVLKGEPDVQGGAATSQIAALAERTTPVPLLNMDAAVDWLRAGRSTAGFESFRELAREAGG